MTNSINKGHLTLEERNLRFGSLAGIQKKITDNSSLYAEVQADTSDERFRDSSWGFTLGFKRTF